MSIFSRKNTDQEVQRADNICEFLRTRVTGSSKRLLQNIQRYKEEPNRCIIRPFDLYLSVVDAVIRNSVNFPESKWYDTVRYGEEIYPHIFLMEERTPNVEELKDIFLEMFDVDGIVSRQMFIPKVYHLFYEKMNYLCFTKGLDAPRYSTEDREAITLFATRIRPFCTDEDVFAAALGRFADRVGAGENPKGVMDEEYSAVCRMAGIYNVSEERIMLAEQKIDAVQAATSRLQDSLALSEERAKVLSELSDSTYRDVKTFCDDELGRARVRIDNLMQQMNRTHDEFMESQRRAILADKDDIVNRVVADSQREISELRKIVDEMVRNARAEIMRANQESGDVMSRLDAYFHDNDRLKEMLADAETSRKLNDRIDRLMVLSEQNLIPQAPPVPPVAPVQPAPPAPPKPQKPAGGKAPVEPPKDAPEPMPNALAETGDVTYGADEEKADLTPTYLLDEAVPFAERMATAMKRKEKMEQKGVHFHKMFDDVLTAVIENANPYLIGPSGCGKTYMVQQIAVILGLESIDIGYINEEYDILGFQTANGGYSKPNFYRCYKYGKIAFCDELDNGNGRATVKLNSFLSNTTNAHYSFPNGERVPRHPNFRIIAAGNTTGNGADINYNTREKIEESVQQRFTPIFVGYDNEVERSILGIYRAWYEFVVAFRKATDAWSKYTHFSAAGIITTRDVTRIRKYLDDRSFPAQKIIEYEFVQTKDAEYLAFLAKEIGAEIKKPEYSEDCRKLYAMFANRVTEIRNGKDNDRLM